MTENIASLIDHTLLRSDAVCQDIWKLCDEAREHHLYAVCVNPYWVTTAKKRLEGSGVKMVAVVGFPYGANLSKAKAFETHAVIEAGADEIDVAMNLGAARENHWDFIEHEIHEVVSAAHGKVVKVILETCYLNSEQIAEACRRVVKAGAHYVKTSTGAGPAGASIEVVQTMRKVVGCRFGVEASGGIRDRVTAERMIEAGADRIGTSSGVAIVTSKKV